MISDADSTIIYSSIHFPKELPLDPLEKYTKSPDINSRTRVQSLLTSKYNWFFSSPKPLSTYLTIFVLNVSKDSKPREQEWLVPGIVTGANSEKVKK